MIICYIIGAIVPFLFRKYGNGKPFFIPTIFASIFAIIFSLNVLFSENPVFIQFNNANQFSINEFLVDNVAAFFILLIGLVSLAVSIYSLGYIKEFIENKHVSLFGFLFNIFILSMVLLVSANDVFSFIVFWELMSLTSFFLVIYNHEKESNLKSGLSYIIMTNIGTGLIFASLFLLYSQTDDFSFNSFRLSSDSFSASLKNIVFILAFVGFGTKAGIVPLHTWLPRAHPSAPSNVSALMSAIMIKTAIYGLIRVIFDFSGMGSGTGDNYEYAWWGILFVTTGAISSIVGVLYSIVEKDIKRALAYSSIENIGIIFIGLGLSIVFTSFNLPHLAALAMLAAMYHVLNHAVFKSLLFMGAGAIIYRTHTGNMEKLGGLIKVMPWTAFLFLIGVLSISGLPFFNGFISEYLLILSLISSSQIPNMLFTIAIGFASVAFALTLGIVVAAFVRIFGISFLSKPRSEMIYKIKEIPKIMLLGIGIMATLCIVLGIVPSIGIILVTEGFSIQTPLQSSLFSLESSILRISEEQHTSSISMPLVLTIFCLVIVATIGFVYGIGGRTTLKRAETWNCGITNLTDRMEYTASSLSQPLFHVFRNFYKPKSKVHTTLYHGTNPYMKKTLNFENINKEIFEDFIYTPLIKMVSVSYDKIRIIQSGKINLYLLNILASIILLLVYVRLFQ